MSFIEGEITVEFGGTVGPAGPAGNAVPIAAGTVLANPSGVLANPVGVDAAGMRDLLSSVAYVSQTLTAPQQLQVLDNIGSGIKNYPLLDNYFFAGGGNTTATGGGNVAGGYLAFSSATTATDCTIVGDRAGRLLTNVVGNTAIGKFSQEQNVTGGNSTSVGDSSLRYTTGEQNVAFGYLTAEDQTTARYGTWIGNGAGKDGGHGDNMVVVGYLAQPGGSGASTTVVGARAKFLGSGAEDAGLGYFTLYNSTGGQNTAVGAYSGFTNTTGYQNTFVGESCGNDAVNQKVDAINSTALGARSYTTKDNQVVIGSSAVVETNLRGKVQINGTLGTPRGQLDVTASSNSDYIIAASNALHGVRMGASAAGVYLDAVDPTLSAAYRPLIFNSSTLGFFGVTPAARPTLPAAATDDGTTLTLVNAIRDLLRNFGLSS
jgi:hypothetical protein